MNTKEYILCSAILRRTPRTDISPYWPGTNDILKIELGYRHHDILQRFGRDIIDTSPGAQGFYTSHGRFVGRAEAKRIAIQAGQVEDDGREDLFSEDLY